MAKAKSKAKPKGSEPRAWQLKITLVGSGDPKVWRRVLLPGDITLGDLHAAIQVAMGWEEAHLHQFVLRGKRPTRQEREAMLRGKLAFEVDARVLNNERCFSDPSFGLEDVEDEFDVRLCDVAPAAKSKLFYQYDFGDSWEHEVRVEKLVAPEPGTPILQCLAGEGACPPEDSGGVWGYYDKLDALKDPGHEYHDEAVEWLGEDYDPAAFDLAAVNREMAEMSGRETW